MKHWHALMARLRDDRGSTLVLTAGFGALALAVILVAVAATSLLIERRRLFSLADGAALAAAEAFALQQITYSGGDAAPTLTDAQVQQAAAEWLQVAPTTLDDARLISGRASDTQSAIVTVGSYWRPPILTAFVPEGLPLDVTVVGRTVFTD